MKKSLEFLIFMLTMSTPSIIITSDAMLAYRRPTIIPSLQRSTVASRKRREENETERKVRTEKKIQAKLKDVKNPDNKSPYRIIYGGILTSPQRSHFEPKLARPSGQQKIPKNSDFSKTFKQNHQKCSLTDSFFLNHYDRSQRK